MPNASTADQRRSQHRAKRGQGELLREELLDATETLLIEKGTMDAVSLRAIAKAVGVTPPSIYLHFVDKDELFFCMCNRRFEQFAGVLHEARDQHPDDALEAFRAMGHAYVRYGLDHAEHYRLLFGDGTAGAIEGRDPSELAGVAMFGELVTLIERGIAAGQFRAVDPFVLAMGTWAAMHGLVLTLIDAGAAMLGDLDAGAITEMAIETWLIGATPR